MRTGSRLAPLRRQAIAEGADLVGGAIIQRASTNPTLWERYDRAVYVRQEDFVAEQRFAATGNLFVRAELFDRVGAFSPELVDSGDVEFGLRPTSAGCRLVFSPRARVLHPANRTLRETWALHRRLGSGFRELARRGLREPIWRDRALRICLGVAVDWTSQDGARVRRRRLVGVHLVAMTARWVGRLTGRPRGLVARVPSRR